jgi:hypothetical protein
MVIEGKERLRGSGSFHGDGHLNGNSITLGGD